MSICSQHVFTLVFGPTLWSICSSSAVCFCCIGHSKLINNSDEKCDSAGLGPVLGRSLSGAGRQCRLTHFVLDKVHRESGKVSMGWRWKLTYDSQQFLGTRKLIEGKVKSGSMIIFNYFSPVLLTAPNTKQNEIWVKSTMLAKNQSSVGAGVSLTASHFAAKPV